MPGEQGQLVAEGDEASSMDDDPGIPPYKVSYMYYCPHCDGGTYWINVPSESIEHSLLTSWNSIVLNSNCLIEIEVVISFEISGVI